MKEVCSIKNKYYDFQKHEYPIELQKQVEKYMGEIGMDQLVCDKL